MEIDNFQHSLTTFLPYSSCAKRGFLKIKGNIVRAVLTWCFISWARGMTWNWGLHQVLETHVESTSNRLFKSWLWLTFKIHSQMSLVQTSTVYFCCRMAFLYRWQLANNQPRAQGSQSFLSLHSYLFRKKIERRDDDLLGQVHSGIALQKHFYWAEKHVQNREKFNCWL